MVGNEIMAPSGCGDGPLRGNTIELFLSKKRCLIRVKFNA